MLQRFHHLIVLKHGTSEAVELLKAKTRRALPIGQCPRGNDFARLTAAEIEDEFCRRFQPGQNERRVNTASNPIAPIRMDAEAPRQSDADRFETSQTQ